MRLIYFQTLTDVSNCLSLCGIALIGVGDGNKVPDKRLGQGEAPARNPQDSILTGRQHIDVLRNTSRDSQNSLPGRWGELVRAMQGGGIVGEGREKGNSWGSGNPIQALHFLWSSKWVCGHVETHVVNTTAQRIRESVNTDMDSTWQTNNNVKKRKYSRTEFIKSRKFHLWLTG